MNTRMPSKGSGVFTPFTGVLPENKAEVVNAGIPLFELICIGVPTGTQLFGFHDVDVKIVNSNRGMGFNLSHDIRWHRGVGNERSYIRYEYDKKTSRSYAFIPDDPVWHNRMLLAETINSGKFAISKYITSDGVISGEAMTAEIKFIASEIFDHSVMKGKEVLFRSKNFEEALKKQQEHDANGVKCQVVHSKIAEIEDIVRRYGYTWKASAEFMNGIRADIEKKIRERFTEEPEPMQQQIADPKELLRSAFAGLSPQERLELLQSSMSSDNGPPPIPEQKPIILEELGNPALKDIAEDLDIFINGMHREDIIKAIKEKQEEIALEMATNTDPNPVISNNETEFK